MDDNTFGVIDDCEMAMDEVKKAMHLLKELSCILYGGTDDPADEVLSEALMESAQLLLIKAYNRSMAAAVKLKPDSRYVYHSLEAWFV